MPRPQRITLNVSLVDVGPTVFEPDSRTIRCGDQDHHSNETLYAIASTEIQCDPDQAYEFHENTTAIYGITGGIPGGHPEWPATVHVGNGGYLRAFFYVGLLGSVTTLFQVSPPWAIFAIPIAIIAVVAVLVVLVITEKRRRARLFNPIIPPPQSSNQ